MKINNKFNNKNNNFKNNNYFNNNNKMNLIIFKTVRIQKVWLQLKILMKMNKRLIQTII